jgi:uncharacterized protein
MPGKFELKKSTNGKCFFNLLASNGQVILTSEMYESKSSALNGIASVQKNSADASRFAKLEGKNKAPYFTLKAGNHQVIGQSQMYDNEKTRDNGIKSCMTNGPSAKTVDLTV